MDKKDTVKPRKTVWQDDAAAVAILKGIVCFLETFLPKTLARRIVGIVLVVSGIPAERVTQLSGLCERSVRTLRKELRSGGDLNTLLRIQPGRGRRSKTAGIEQEILGEIETGNYHTRQQIAEMIEHKFQIKISVSAVGKLLKKTDFGA